MRDLLLLIIIFASIPISFIEPFYGVLVWIWISYFNPHRYTFSYMYNFPVALVIAVPTLAGLFFTRKLNHRFMVRETALLSMLWIWFILTYINATQVPLFQLHILDAESELVRVSKILLMTFVTILLVTSHKRLKQVFLVTALSFIPLVLKAVIFGWRTGGQDRVWGPPDSFLADNNGFALAVNMSLPILFYFGREEKNPFIRRLLNIGFVCGIATVILTYSRGGLLGLAAVLLMIAFKSRYRVLSSVLLLLSLFLVLTFAPEKWMERMGTITGSEQKMDDSAKQRIVAWGTTWNFVMDYPIAGGSFRSLPNVDLFQRYQPEPLPEGYLSTAPHSIYFQTLGEQGFVGLLLYLALIGSTLISLYGLRRRAKLLESAAWMITYIDIIQASLTGFLVSGAFLGFANFDLFYEMIACAIILKILWQRELAVQSAAVAARVPTLAESGAL
ncbi:MAG TPA: putative O-glycosylation ligase, exosortase A system-associated [Candidatus Acidoferrales bacterium]|nr:putative O-glycosylation ligase, exosortase A system-associated [Candidatus Acidoferrales bacterium]